MGDFRRLAAIVGLAAAGLSATAPSAGAAATQIGRGKVTWLLSRSEHNGLPNGASCCGVVSHDARIGRVMAFASLANDITPGVRRGVANVYAVFRRGPWADNGTLWVPQETVLVSRGLGGRPANGASFAPALGGDSGNAPRCVAFVSRASNLVRGDRNHHADAFVADLQTRRIVRVSVDSAGHEANGTTSEVAVAATAGASPSTPTRPTSPRGGRSRGCPERGRGQHRPGRVRCTSTSSADGTPPG